MNQITVKILSGTPGCGKTTRMMQTMASEPGRYIFAMPRNQLIDEREASLRKFAAQAGTNPIIAPIHSHQGLRGSVARRVRDAIRDFQDVRHAVLLISHEMLTTTSFDECFGWHAMIDEVPDAVASGILRIPASIPLLEGLYDLDPITETKWSKLVVRRGAPKIRDFLRDDIADGLSVIHKRALSPQGVLVDVTDWTHASGSQSVQWVSAWTPLELASMTSITIAASGFQTSICHLATSAWFPDHVRYAQEIVGGGRASQPAVRIHYYARHRGSTAFWRTEQGRRCLQAVGNHLASVQPQFWSGNEVVRDRFEMTLSGAMARPKQAGTNEYRDLQSCAYIYSNKAQTSDTPILDAFGLIKSDIERAREAEDIAQFALRGSIRCPEFDGTYDIFLYDVFQAETLAGYLRNAGFINVEVIGLEEVGIMDEVRPTPGRKPVELDAATATQRRERRLDNDRLRKRNARAKEAEAKRAAGTLRKRGRPSKTVTGPST